MPVSGCASEGGCLQSEHRTVAWGNRWAERWSVVEGATVSAGGVLGLAGDVDFGEGGKRRRRRGDGVGHKWRKGGRRRRGCGPGWKENEKKKKKKGEKRRNGLRPVAGKKEKKIEERKGGGEEMGLGPKTEIRRKEKGRRRRGL